MANFYWGTTNKIIEYNIHEFSFNKLKNIWCFRLTKKLKENFKTTRKKKVKRFH